MAKDPYSHDFILISEDSSDEKQPPIPYKTQSPRVLQAKSSYQKQMDNYNEMLQKAFEKWPKETVVERDTLTWLPKDSLDKTCAKRNGKIGDYAACTFHNEPPLSEFRNSDFPVAGSHTYMLKSLPKSMWEGIGNHEKDHHAASSAKQSAAYDYFQNIFLWGDSKELDLLKGTLWDLESINDYMENTNWLQRDNQGEFTIEKELNHEPSIQQILLDYLNAAEENNDR